MAYKNVSGFEESKLNDPNHNTPKYKFMRAVQDLGLPAIGLNEGQGDRAAMSARLGEVAAKAGATQVGDDKLDFGDGFGPQDVLTGQGQWWWEGNGGHPGGGAPAATAPSVARTASGPPSMMSALSQLGTTVGTPLVDPNAAGADPHSLIALIAQAVAEEKKRRQVI